jgi:hypothetical protein
VRIKQLIAKEAAMSDSKSDPGATRTAYVICCNDSTEAVVLDDEKRAANMIDPLARVHYARQGQWGGIGQRTYKEYRAMFYWHIHLVPVL